MDGRPTWTDSDEAGDYAVPNVLSPRDLVFRPDNMDETVPHTHTQARLYMHSESLSFFFHNYDIYKFLHELICIFVFACPKKKWFSHDAVHLLASKI